MKQTAAAVKGQAIRIRVPVTLFGWSKILMPGLCHVAFIACSLWNVLSTVGAMETTKYELEKIKQSRQPLREQQPLTHSNTGVYLCKVDPTIFQQISSTRFSDIFITTKLSNYNLLQSLIFS